MMIKNLMLVIALFSVSFSYAQPVTEPDKSPLDVSYSPQGYPVLKFQNKKFDAKPNARVIYSRPQVKGRVIFGGEIKYGDLWRLGANEATEFELFKPATIGGKKLLKGRYTLYCIPEADQWTFVFNRDTDSWGGFSYRQELDVARVKVPVVKQDTPVEYLTIYFDNPNTMVVLWADVKASLPIDFTAK